MSSPPLVCLPKIIHDIVAIVQQAMTLVRVACRRQDSLTLLYETLRERYRRHWH
ncbi:hypothetical protein [Nostoc sp. FACHB-888]|uniref:hypothetical protein n=1 Tax=Nostoc sp. FACHB-888 TaxID=2692842 RepID=UPI0016874D14|nr:hypothetical protein [Nostoc sp. FACHB-888]MBD2246926.1 hypothetical protein [Nostoc sp. FACHB-888]